VQIVRAQYADFGPTLAHEKLVEQHGVRVSVETLRQWMVAAALWTPRAPRCVLLVYVDDATSRLMQLRFAESESTFAYVDATRGYLLEHGRPVAFYSDKAAVFRVNAKEPRGGDGTTQFARAMGQLNVDVLCANSPQAQGRVERANLTLQDRLVKELRLKNISSPEAANAFAPQFIADYNRRFARLPASHHDAHRPLRQEDDLKEILRWKEQRRLTLNLKLHYRRSLYVVDETPAALAARGKLVDVHELPDGTVCLRHGSSDLTATTFRKAGDIRQQDIDDNKYLGAILSQLRTQQLARDEAALISPRTTLREKRLLRDSLAKRRGATSLALLKSGGGVYEITQLVRSRQRAAV
jgi:hypothetical protein